MQKQLPQEIIRSSEKWYLGGGKEAIWAPDLPTYLDTPGFWDNACYLEWKVEPCYTITVLDEELHQIPMKLEKRDWIPSKLTQVYKPVSELTFVEDKCLLPNDVMLSELTIRNAGRKTRKIYFIMWTQIQCGKPHIHGIYKTNFQMRNNIFSHELIPFGENNELQTNFFFSMAMKTKPRSHIVVSSEIIKHSPSWLFSALYQRMTKNGFDNSFTVSGGHRKDLGDTIIFSAFELPIMIASGQSKTFTTACALANSLEKSRKQLSMGLSLKNPMKTSFDNWENFFSQVPSFESSDECLSKYYWYRWYGIKLNMNISEHKNSPYPCVFEGINHSWFRHHISYSAQCHMLETRWMHSPELAKGSLLNFVHNQMKDGRIPGAVFNRKSPPNMFIYHANWGYGIRKVYESHPDKTFLKKVYPAMGKYICYFERERDKERTNLYDVISQGETGQEYMSRYLFVDKKGDQWGELNPHLKGVDATIYIYELVRTMAWMAEKLGYSKILINKWNHKADKIKDAVLKKMWDAKSRIFRDLNSKTLRKSPVKTSVLFYPFFTDIPSKRNLGAIYNHLLNPREFWTKYPCPSTSADEPYFSEYGEWKGQRKHCPWNGVSWLMTNSHIAEALVQSAERLDSNLEKYAVEFINKFIRMTFINGDINRPSSYEYYNPFDGKAPFFRGVDDYMHSWINELILKYVCGIRTSDDNTLTIKPLDFGLSHFTVENLKLRGKLLRIIWRKSKIDSEPQGLSIYINNRLAHHSQIMQNVIIKL